MTKKDYFIENSWKTTYHKCRFCPPDQQTWSIEEQEVIAFDNGWTICEKCFLREEEEENDTKK